MRSARIVMTVVALVASAAPPVQATEPRPGAQHAVGVHGTLIRGYDAPDDPYAPGHRGLDVAVAPGTPLRASADGVVAFAGTVAGNLTVSVDHPGGVRTTASYLGSLAVTAGRSVARGDVLGSSGNGHPNSGRPPHVHLSMRRDGVYLDPLPAYIGDWWGDLVVLVA